MNKIELSHLDHLVLNTSNLQKTLEFYTSILGCEEITFSKNRKALRFGNQKINLHLINAPISPHAKHPIAGSLDLCFIIKGSLKDALSVLIKHQIPYEGIVERTGALGPIQSIYLKDPDGNLIELSTYR